ncbi:hypothetical protein D3C81_1319700 [compost metagenome]
MYEPGFLALFTRQTDRTKDNQLFLSVLILDDMVTRRTRSPERVSFEQGGIFGIGKTGCSYAGFGV